MKHRFSERLKLPTDLTRGDLLMSFTGNCEVFIETYKGIVAYTDTCILLAGKHGQVQLTGTCLAITYYTDDEMRIEGRFSYIEFLD